MIKKRDREEMLLSQAWMAGFNRGRRLRIEHDWLVVATKLVAVAQADIREIRLRQKRSSNGRVQKFELHR